MSDEQVEHNSNTRESRIASNKWKYPKTPINKIYDKKIFDLFPNYTIKDLEETDTFTEHKRDVYIQPLCNLINLRRDYKFLHLGLIQVAIKPLARVGIGAPIVVCLRDDRHRDFHSSLLAMVELDSTNGPFYFNCSPNFAVPFKECVVSELLALQIKTNGIPLALTYRVVVKGMHDLENTKALLEYLPGETTYVQGSVTAATKWDQVHIPESWIKLLADREERENARVAAHVKMLAQFKASFRGAQGSREA